MNFATFLIQIHSKYIFMEHKGKKGDLKLLTGGVYLSNRVLVSPSSFSCYVLAYVSVVQSSQ